MGEFRVWRLGGHDEPIRGMSEFGEARQAPAFDFVGINRENFVAATARMGHVIGQGGIML